MILSTGMGFWGILYPVLDANGLAMILKMIYCSIPCHFQAIPSLVEILQNNEGEDAEICAAAWTLGHIAKHSPQHSLAVAVANALPRLLQVSHFYYLHIEREGTLNT